MSVFRPTYTDPKTGERKRSKVWWYNFFFAGRRIRETAKTTRKTIALEAEKRRRLELERSLAGLPAERPEDRIQTVAAALGAYRKAYRVNHRAKSLAVVEERSPHLERLLGGLLLPDLTQERIVGYMDARQQEGASNRTINMELAVLSRAMGQTWRVLWPKVRKLEENRDVGRGLEPEEERAIPMGGPLRAALEHHAVWYAPKLGPIRPEHYVFPAMNRTMPVDATRPVRSLKGAWGSIRAAAKVDCRLHDLRHSFCTKLAEAGVPEATMLDIMGHVSAVMLKRYSHIRAKARRDAITALEAAQVSVGTAKEITKVGDFAASGVMSKLLN